MSDNELRDRIAKVLFDRDQVTLERRGFFKMRWEESDAKYLRPWRREAQAIIDDLGLTVEERFVYATDLARDAEPVTDAMAHRVVGKWKRSDHRRNDQ